MIANAEAKSLAGDHTIEVINLNTSYTWFIEYEYYPRDYPTPLIDSASPGTANDNFVAGIAIAAEEKALVVDISPSRNYLESIIINQVINHLFIISQKIFGHLQSWRGKLKIPM